VIRITADDIAALEQRTRTHFVNSLPGCKSANLVGTASPAGVTNLCMVSSTLHIGSSPPLLAFVSRPHTVRRDTLENIMATGVFTINHVNASIVEQAHQTAARYDADVSEFAATGLSERWTDFPAPFVAAAGLAIGLRLRERIDVASNGTHLVIGEVVEVWLRDDVRREDGSLDLEALGSLAVTGLDTYHRTLQIMRLPYAKP
jgi:flavin reductase (DIM6/NTAB) family NADH-FMN oxidoreductase RutF